MDQSERVEMELARQIRPLVDHDLTVVFYDLTTVRIHGGGAVENDLRAFGMNKETGGIARQFLFGAAQAADGLLVLPRLRSGLSTHLGSLSFEGQGAFAAQR